MLVQDRGEVIGDEVRVTVRVVAEEEERVLEGALHRIADELAELLEDRGVCRRRQPPEEMRIPASAMLAYERAAALAFESLLADDRNQAIVAVPGRAGAAAAAARDLAASHPGSRVLQLLWASTAIRADDADELSDEDWDRLTDRCDDVTDWLFPIAPLLLRRLESDGAEERRQELLASRPATYRSPPDPFAAWLEGLDLEPDDDGDDAP